MTIAPPVFFLRADSGSEHPIKASILVKVKVTVSCL